MEIQTTTLSHPPLLCFTVSVTLSPLHFTQNLMRSYIFFIHFTTLSLAPFFLILNQELSYLLNQMLFLVPPYTSKYAFIWLLNIYLL